METRDGIAGPYRLDDLPVLDAGTHPDTPPRMLVQGAFGTGAGVRGVDDAALAAGARASDDEEAASAWSVVAALVRAGGAELRVDACSGTVDELLAVTARAIGGPYDVVIALHQLGHSARDLRALERCAAMGRRVATPFLFGASDALVELLRGEVGAEQGRVHALRGQEAARWVCLVPGRVELDAVNDSQRRCVAPGVAALALCIARAWGAQRCVTNFIGLDTGGALDESVRVLEPRVDAAAWVGWAAAGLVAPCRSEDGRAYFPGAPTFARVPPLNPPFIPAEEWLEIRSQVLPSEQRHLVEWRYGNQLATQLPWVLFSGRILHVLAETLRMHLAESDRGEAGPEAAKPEGVRRALQSRLMNWALTHGAAVVQAVRRRRPVSERSRVVWVAAGEDGYHVALLIVLYAVGGPVRRPYVPLVVRGHFAAARADLAAPDEDDGVAELGASLLRAIHLDPDDDDARLVYADHLVERGDPQGELIGLQIARAQGRASAAQRQREQELLDAHLARWLVPFSPCVSRAELERGFVERVELDNFIGIETVASYEGWATVRAIALETPRGWESAPMLLRSPALCAVREIRGLHSTWLPHVVGHHGSRLERVSLVLGTRADVDDEAILDALAEMPQLRSLELVVERNVAQKDVVANAAQLERYRSLGFEELGFTAAVAKPAEVLKVALSQVAPSRLPRFVFSPGSSLRAIFTRDHAGGLSVLRVQPPPGAPFPIDRVAALLAALAEDAVTSFAVIPPETSGWSVPPLGHPAPLISPDELSRIDVLLKRFTRLS
jgi:uncharacterized protein (TIGR02996 family)